MTEDNGWLKKQAQEIMVAVDRDIQKAESTTLPQEVDDKANSLMQMLFGVIQDVDIAAAAERVKALKEKYPQLTLGQLAQRLIRDKCQRTGTVGAVTSGAGLIPGIGTAAAVTLGVAADIGATFRLQAELVLEIAMLYNYPLTEKEKQQLVLLITGLSAGTSALARRAGQAIALELSEKLAQKAILKALPVVGVIASASTNALATYIIGQRAEAYFRLGPEAVPTWADSLRAISGVDERKLGAWLWASGKATGNALMAGASRVGEAGKSAGESLGPSLSSGAKKAKQTATKGFKAYLRMYIHNWKMMFRFAQQGLGFIWMVLSFIPRKLMGLFRPKNQALPIENEQ